MIQLGTAAKELLAGRAALVEPEEWLERRLQTDGTCGAFEAAERAEQYGPRFRDVIGFALDDMRLRGITPPYLWADPDRRALGRYTDYVSADLRPETERVLLFQPKVAEACRSLTGRQFELLVVRLMMLYGAGHEQAVASPQSNDGGIDFYARLTPATLPGRDRFRDLHLRVVGQAKKHLDHPIGPDDMKAFAGRVADMRIGHYGSAAPPTWFQSSSEPIIGVFATLGSYGPDARSIANEAVVFLLDGDQVVEDLLHGAWVEGWISPANEFIIDRFVETFAER